MSQWIKKRGLALILVLVMIITVFPVQDVRAKTSKNAVPALAKSSVTLYLKSKYSTDYQLQIDNMASDATVTYKSSNKKIARVNEEGLVSPVKTGTATITAKVKQNGKTYKLSLKCTVKKAALSFSAAKAKNTSAGIPAFLTIGESFKTGLKLSGQKVSVYSSSNSKKYNVKAVIYDAATGKKLTSGKSAAKNKYIKISKNGTLTAKKAGEYYIVFTSYPKGCRNTIYVNAVEKIHDYRVDFAFTSNSEQYGEILPENGGATLPSGGVYTEGTAINTLPLPEMLGGIFMGWYYDAEMTKPVAAEDLVDSDMTLYAEMAEGDGAELVETPVYYSVNLEPERVEGYSFEIRGYASDIIESFVDVSDNSAVEYRAEGERIYPVLEEGKSYAVSLKNDGISYDENVYFIVDGEAQLPSVVTLNIITGRTEVMNLSLSEDLIYIGKDEISEVKGQMLEGLFTASFDGTEGSTAENGFTGTFRYNGSEKLQTGDKLAIYEGVRPDKRKIDTMGTKGDGEIVYITVTGTDGNKISYRNSEADEVIRFTEVLPVPADADMDNDPSNGSITVKASVFDFSPSKYAELGLGADTTVDVGDFMLFYSNSFEKAELVSYGRVTSVSKRGTDYIIGYTDATEDEVDASMDIYTSKNEEINLTDEQINMIENEIEQQAYESGFIDEASEYLAALAMETDGFKELSDDLDFDLDSYNIRLEGATVNGDADAMALMGSKVTATVKDPKVEVSVKPNQKLSHYLGRKGLKASLKLTVKVEVKSDKIPKGHLEIEIVAFFDEEVFIDLSTSSSAIWKKKWIFKYIADYSITANLDFGTFTSVGITATIKTVETPEKLEVPEDITWNVDKQKKTAEGIADIGKQMKKLLESKGIFGSKNASNSAASDALSKKYADFIKKSSDSWITIVEKEIFSAEGGIDPLHILAFSVSCNFIVKVNLYLTMGVTLETGEAKRYTFKFVLKEKKATTGMVNLENSYTQVEFYVFGTAGLKVGFEFEVGVGLLSAKLDSIGVSAEVGAYIQLWGFFYLKYKETINSNKQKITEKTYSGALFIEIGIYLEIHFKAQLFGSKKLTYEPTLYENSWPICSFGAKKNIRKFAIAKDATYSAEYNMINSKELVIPSSVFDMTYLDLKDGKTGTVNYDDSSESKFTISFTNKKFSYDAKNNKIKVNPSSSSLKEETDMKITFKGNSLAFTSEPITITVKATWTNPAKERQICFVSNGGSAVKTVSAAVGVAIKKPADPTKKGYVFDGWYSDISYKNKFSFPSKMPEYTENAGIVYVYAKWSPAKNTKYTVNYYLQNTDGRYSLWSTASKTGETGTVPSDSTLKISIPNAVYYRMVSSEIKPDGSTVISLYYNIDKVTITFTYGKMKDGTEATKDIVVNAKYGSKLYPPVFNVQGYVFGGFYSMTKDADGYVSVYSARTYEAKWTPAKDTKYTVEKYVQNDKGVYELASSVTAYGETGYTPKSYELAGDNDFKYRVLNINRSVLSPIKPDGTSVMKLYYDITESTVRISYGEFSSAERPDIVVKYRNGEIFTATELFVPGYKMRLLRFGGSAYLTIGSGMTIYQDTVLTAEWETADDTAYTVEHYVKQSDGKYKLTDTDRLSGTTNNKPSVSELKRNYENTAVNEEKCIITPIDSMGGSVMKLYYDPIGYYVTFTYGEFRQETGERADITEWHLTGEEIYAPDLEVQGYVFKGFEGLDESGKLTVDREATFTAKWVPASDTPYKVEYYGEASDDDGYILLDTDNLKGTTGATVEAQYADIAHYSPFTGHSNTVRSGVIAADGSTVLKLYYKVDKFTLTFDANGGTLGADGASKTFKYGQMFDVTIPVRDGFGFSGWADAATGAAYKAASVTAEVSLKATWTQDESTYEVWHYIEQTDGNYPAVPVRETKKGYAGTVLNNSDSAASNSFVNSAYLTEGIWFAGSSLDPFAAANSAIDGNDKEMFYKNPTLIPGMVIAVYYKRAEVEITWNYKEYEPVNKDSFTSTTRSGEPYIFGSTFVAPVFNVPGFTAKFSPELPATVPSENTCYSVSFVPISYTIAFDGNGADSGSVDSIPAVYSEEYTLPSTGFVRSGYHQIGWSVNKDATTDTPAPGNVVPFAIPVSRLTATDKATVTMYAIWSPDIPE